MRALIILRDALLALALGWLGISIEPVATPAPKSCPSVSGPAPAGACPVSRRPSLDLAATSIGGCGGAD